MGSSGPPPVRLRLAGGLRPLSVGAGAVKHGNELPTAVELSPANAPRPLVQPVVLAGGKAHWTTTGVVWRHLPRTRHRQQTR